MTEVEDMDRMRLFRGHRCRAGEGQFGPRSGGNCQALYYGCYPLWVFAWQGIRSDRSDGGCQEPHAVLMRVRTLHLWNVSPQEAMAIQLTLRSQLRLHGTGPFATVDRKSVV